MTIFVGVNDDKVKAEAVEVFTRYMQARRLRKTAERYAILDVALAMPGHFSVATLIESMAEGPLSVSRATVYNTVGLLIDCGLLRCHHFDGRHPRYEMVAGRRANHLHLVCSRCGKVREVTDVEVERLVNTRRFETFHPEYFDLSIHGLCSRCQRRRRRQS